MHVSVTIYGMATTASATTATVADEDLDECGPQLITKLEVRNSLKRICILLVCNKVSTESNSIIGVAIQLSVLELFQLN